MGFNSTLVVMNDALLDIKRDPEIGEKIYDGICKLSSYKRETIVTISALNFINAMYAIETHPSDFLVPVLVGGNHGRPIENVSIGYAAENPELTLLKELADKLGYRISRKSKK